jgi:hypothetical protein
VRVLCARDERVVFQDRRSGASVNLSPWSDSSLGSGVRPTGCARLHWGSKASGLVDTTTTPWLANKDRTAQILPPRATQGSRFRETIGWKSDLRPTATPATVRRQVRIFRGARRSWPNGVREPRRARSRATLPETFSMQPGAHLARSVPHLVLFHLNLWCPSGAALSPFQAEVDTAPAAPAAQVDEGAAGSERDPFSWFFHSGPPLATSFSSGRPVKALVSFRNRDLGPALPCFPYWPYQGRPAWEA